MTKRYIQSFENLLYPVPSRPVLFNPYSQPNPTHTYLNAEGTVERISRGLRLSSSCRLRSRRRSTASRDCRRTRLTLARQLLADEVANDLDVQRRPMVEISRVLGLEARLLAAVKIKSELNSGTATGTGIERSPTSLAASARDDTALGALGRRLAVRLLGFALGRAALDGARVGGVGARVVLHGARPLEGGSLVEEGRAVDGEWAVGPLGELDGRGGAAEGAREGLHVYGSGGGGGGTSVSGGSGGTSGGAGGGGCGGITCWTFCQMGSGIRTVDMAEDGP